VECQAVDAAARQVIEEGGFGPGYSYFTHRLGHGIGLDGHEWPYMVRGDRTRLLARMTFTDEPGTYIPGELGIRHEDTLAVTENRLREPAAEGSECLGGAAGVADSPATLKDGVPHLPGRLGGPVAVRNPRPRPRA
jgi:Xaa-Pro aminopeptidase